MYLDILHSVCKIFAAELSRTKYIGYDYMLHASQIISNCASPKDEDSAWSLTYLSSLLNETFFRYTIKVNIICWRQVPFRGTTHVKIILCMLKDFSFHIIRSLF